MRTGFSVDIGMRGPRAPGAPWEFSFSREIFCGTTLSKLVWQIDLDKVGIMNVGEFLTVFLLPKQQAARKA